jgi:hypothetical protein
LSNRDRLMTGLVAEERREGLMKKKALAAKES